MRRSHIIILLTLLLTFFRSEAMCVAESETIEVSIVNFYPGSDIYELEGHTALRIKSNLRGDMAVSYGTFDFNAPGFVYRFVKGETDYWMSIAPWDMFISPYIQSNRRIVEHIVDMTYEQKKILLMLLAENIKPENRTYRYNYVKDNCATRPLRIIEQAIGDSIILGDPQDVFQGNNVTFRAIMRHYHANYPWYQFGIDLCLGSGVDYTLNNREKAFAPALLDAQLSGATVAGKPLIKNVVILNDVPADNAIEKATPWYATPMTATTLILALSLLIAITDIRRHKIRRWYYSAMATIFGIMGLLIWFLVFVSSHEATTPNILMFWLNPLWLVPAVTIMIKSLRRFTLAVMTLEGIATLATMLIWAFQSQVSNIAFWPLILCSIVLCSSYLSCNLGSILKHYAK